MLFTLLGVMLTAMVLIALSWRQVIVDVGALSLFLDLPRHVTRTLSDRYASLSSVAADARAMRSSSFFHWIP